MKPEEYLRERVDNIGIPPSVAIGEQCKGLEIPHECLDHPYMRDMMAWCSELVTLQNVSNLLSLALSSGKSILMAFMDKMKPLSSLISPKETY